MSLLKTLPHRMLLKLYRVCRNRGFKGAPLVFKYISGSFILHPVELHELHYESSTSVVEILFYLFTITTSNLTYADVN